MQVQFSQDYDVDSRYHGMKRARDNTAGKAFAKAYIQRQRQGGKTEITESRQEDNRFIIAGPGDSKYSFRNSFRASK